MRSVGALLAVTVVTSLGLAACGQPKGQATGSETADAVPADAPAAAEAAAPAAGLTDEQKAALVATLPAPYNGGDLANGKKVYLVCKSCHTTVQGGANMTGPNLWGLFGRKAGVEGGFAYSDDLKALGVSWDAATLDKWVENPKAMAAGTKMSFMGVKAPKDRVDLIAYLKAETSPAAQ